MNRLLLFAALLLLGFLLLQWSLGGEDFAKVSGPPVPEAGESDRPPQQPGGLHLQSQQGAVELTLNGQLTIPRSRDIRDGNRILHQPVYELRCADSRPVGEGLQQLDDVRMLLYDRGQHVADLTAKTAFVELAPDANGRASLREDKEVLLQQAVLSTVPGARLGPLRLELEQVQLRVRDDEIELHTPTAQERVLLVVQGERAGSLSGRGLQARLPRDANGQLRRIDLEILRDGVLTTDDFEAHAKGRMHYVEQTERGAALLTVDDAVRLQLRAPARTAERPLGGDLQVHGDHLALWLVRPQPLAGDGGRDQGSKDGGKNHRKDSGLLWQLLRIDGAPATAVGGGLDLRAAQLTVAPGPAGQPYLLTAAGGRAVLVQTQPSGRDAAPAAVLSRFEARRIHLLRPGAQVGAVHAAYGFSSLALGQLQRLQIGICEGETDVVAEGAELHAQRGLWVLQADSGQQDAGVRMLGHGDVRIGYGEGARRIVATGNDGCELRRRALAGAPAQLEETLWLGGRDAGPGHRFTLRRGETELHGSGSCVLERVGTSGPDAPATVTAALRSPAADLAGSFGDPVGSLQAAATIDATLRGDELLQLRATGPQLSAEVVRGDATLQAKASLLVQESPTTLRLEGAAGQPAELRRRGRGQGGSDDELALQGPLLRIHRVHQQQALLVAETVGGRRPHLAGEGTPEAHGRTTFALDADRIQVLPFGVPADAIAAHTAGLPWPLQRALGGGLQQPWLLADGDLQFTVVEAGADEVVGSGDHLALALGSRSGPLQGSQPAVAKGNQSALLFGDAASGRLAALERRRPDGSSSKLRGPRLRLWQDDGVRVVVFTTFAGGSDEHRPEVELHQPGANPAELAHLWAACDGAIELLPDRVVYRGPVTVHGLRPDGSEDPDGMRLSAGKLQMLRNERFEVVKAVASDDVVFDWRRVHARAATVTIDAATSLCTIADPAGAEISGLPGFAGGVIRVLQARINYRTWGVDLWQFAAQPTAQAGGRP